MTKFKVGDRVRVNHSYSVRPEFIGCFGTVTEVLSAAITFRLEGGGCTRVAIGSPLYFMPRFLEIIGEPIKAVADKTDQELADEYRAAFVICDETRRELEKRGYSTKLAGRVLPALTVPLATVEFERVVTNVEKV